jgi:chromosomal replication initiation ATPase DnaA
VDRIMAATSTCRRPATSGIGGHQLRAAFRSLLEPQAATVACNPLCVVTPGGRSPLLAEFADWAVACGFRVLVRGGRDLGQEIAAAVAADSWDRLRQRFTGAQVVVIEHLETLRGRSRLTAFRHVFDAATAGDTRFCISLANHPLSGQFDPDLAGRLAGGLILPLVNVEPAAIAPLATDQPHSAARVADRLPSLARVLAATARHYGLSVESLVGAGRSRTVSQARSLAMHLARQLTKQSFAAIGRACGGRDHTTALHGSRVTAARIAADPILAADAATILAALSERPRPASRNRRLSMDCQ